DSKAQEHRSRSWCSCARSTLLHWTSSAKRSSGPSPITFSPTFTPIRSRGLGGIYFVDDSEHEYEHDDDYDYPQRVGMSGFLVAVDQGTTGSTVLVLDEQLKLRGRGYREFPQHYPKPGWVEHDPEEIWGSVLGALSDALGGNEGADTIDPRAIAAIGITN